MNPSRPGTNRRWITAAAVVGRERLFRWTLIAAIGLLSLAVMQAAMGPAYRESASTTLSQPSFERAIIAPPGARYALSELVVHPPEEDGSYWVTGSYRLAPAFGDAGPLPFKFRAPTPYVPQFSVDMADPKTFTIVDYLNQMASRVPQAHLVYRYAWYEQPHTGPILLIGAVLLAISAARAVFILKRHRISSRGSAELPVMAAPVESHSIANDAEPAQPVDIEIHATEQAIQRLTTEPLKPQAELTPGDRPEYHGRYYPTAAHAHDDAASTDT